MTQRLTALEVQITNGKTSLDGLREEISAASEDVKTEITSQTTELQTKIDVLEAAINAHQATLDAQLATQTQVFDASQTEHGKMFREELDDLTSRADSELEERVREIRRMAEETGALVGAIALSGTADKYKDEADKQKRVADLLRNVTILFAIGSVGMAVWAVVHQADDTNSMVAKLAVSAVLGGLAGYTAQQSGRHRHREERAREIQLQLTAFSPFIEPLDADFQQAARLLVASRVFGQFGTGTRDEADEVGPAILSLLKRRTESSSDDETA
jgi:hypothetical protein